MYDIKIKLQPYNNSKFLLNDIRSLYPTDEGENNTNIKILRPSKFMLQK